MKAPAETTHARSSKRAHPRWRRWRIAFGIAVVEGVVVALSSDISRWTVVALAVAAVALYVTAGRRTQSRTVHDILWIFACSQVLAVVVAVVSFFISWIGYVLAAVLALVMLILLAVDR
jgi:drug/metabolite transporter (DMT)-like permease